jgi:LAO/AO transport system kinase
VAAPGVPAPDPGVPATDPSARARELTEAAVAGDRRALARLLTAVENRTPVAEAALRTLYPMAGRAHLVGITGPPGAGKSTLVAALIAEVRAHGRTVGVVAVDPSSPITGGALLGDRVRMQSYAADRDVFIRSMAARGHAGGLASTSAAAAAVLDACGFDMVLLETVGTGQSEVEVAAAADTTVVLEAPEMGDEIQAIKAGLLEVADIVVVNKGDRPGAQRTASQLRAMLVAVARVGTTERGHHGAAAAPDDDPTTPPTAAGKAGAAPASPDDRPRPKQPEVLVTTATTGEGIPELLASLDRHRAAGQGGGATSSARLARAEAQVRAILAERTRAELDSAERREGTRAILRAVADHELDPFTAVDRLLASLRE